MARRDTTRVEGELTQAYRDLRRFAAVVADADFDPDDICQEAMTRVLLAARRGRGPADDVIAYARRSIVSVCSNQRRGLARRTAAFRRVGMPEDIELPIYPSEFDVLDDLAPRERAVLYLQHVEGRTSTEIGALLGLSSTSVRATASRARRRLRVETSEEVAAEKEA